ncbi:MAG: hypothetical protein ACFFB0_07755 [Promethearchaeota archaeon]
MSSGKLDKDSQEVRVNHHKIVLERSINISQIAIPFSKMSKSYKPIDIYSGSEKIPFKERDPKYKMILKQEFTNTLKDEFKVYKSVIKFPTL